MIQEAYFLNFLTYFIQEFFAGKVLPGQFFIKGKFFLNHSLEESMCKKEEKHIFKTNSTTTAKEALNKDDVFKPA